MTKKITNHIEVYTGLESYTIPMLRRIENAASPIKQIINGQNVAKFHRLTGDLVRQTISQRIEKGLAIKNLIRREDQAQTIELTNPATLKETRLLPPDFNLNIMFAVFGDTVTLTSLETSDPVGVIINDPAIAKAFDTLFDFIWNSSTPV